MTEIATCTNCGQRFHSGFKRDRPVCGVCQPIDGGVDWRKIPRRPKADPDGEPVAYRYVDLDPPED